MIKQINNITGEEIEISEEEFMEMLSSGEVTLSGIQQVVTNADGEQRTNQLYGTDMLNDDRWDRSVNIFGATSAVFRLGLLKARKVKEENVDEEYIFQMDNSVQNYEIVVDDMELPNMHILKFTEEGVQIASYIRDEQKSVGTPINEKEYRFENGRLSARIENVTADTALLNVFGVYEAVKLLEERNLLQELKNKENMGTGVLLNVIAEGTAEEYIETRVVCGLERPELPCVMFGGLFAESMDDVIMMRPYPDEVFNSWMPGMDNSYDRFARLKKRVEAGEQGALGQLAKEYMQAGSETFGEEQDEYYRLCIENAQKAIENGDLYGYWLLALTYERGRGVEPDVEKAIEYYKEGSKLGEPNCQNSLACYFMRGEGVTENRGAAFKLFEKSALQGNKLAEFSLCKCYEYGHGTEVNLEKAIEWGEKAAVDASADVQYEVGKLYTYTNESGKMINAERARYWLSQAVLIL